METSSSGAACPSASTSTGGSKVTMRETRRAVLGRGVTQVGDLALTQHLHAVRVDVVEVPTRSRPSGAADGHFVKRRSERPSPATLPAQLAAKGLEQDIGADDVGFHSGRSGLMPPGWIASRRSCRAAGPRR